MKYLSVKVDVMCKVSTSDIPVVFMTHMFSVPAPQHMSKGQFTDDLRTVFSRLLNEKEEQIKIEFID